MIPVLAMFIGLAGAHDVDRLVQAIEMAENSPWDSPGGGLQFTEAAWREETDLPYKHASIKTTACKFAAQRLERYARSLHALGIKPTPYLMGCIWNKGFTGTLQLRRANIKCGYGERVHNLFHAYTK